MISATQIQEAEATFERVFARMRPAELARWMNANGAEMDPNEIEYSDYAEGALTEWEWDKGRGSFDESNHYFADGMNGKRAYQWYQHAKSSFAGNPAAFVNQVTEGNESRAIELIQWGHSSSEPRGDTLSYLWNVSVLSSGYDSLFTSAEEGHPKAIRPVLVERYGANYRVRDISAWPSSAVTTNIEGIAGILLSQPKGKRFLALSQGSPGLGPPLRAGLIYGINDHPNWINYGKNLHDQRASVLDVALTHPHRVGIGQEAWKAAILASDGPWIQFLQGLYNYQQDNVPAGNRPIIDGVFFDVEWHRRVRELQTGFATMDDAFHATVATFGGGTTVPTTANHNYETGWLIRVDDTIAYGGSAGTVNLRPFFVRAASPNTLSFHLTPDDASMGSNPVSLPAALQGKVLRRCGDSWDWIFEDDFWPTFRTVWLRNKFTQIQLAAGLSVKAWHDGTLWSWSADHRAFYLQAALDEYHFGTLAQVLGKVRDYWPNALVTDWDMEASAVGLRGFDNPGRHAPFSMRCAPGDIGGTLYGNIAGNRFHPSTFTTTSITSAEPARTWARTTMNVDRIHANTSGTKHRYYPWLGHRGSSGGGIPDMEGDFWNENALLGAMASSGLVGCYNTGMNKTAHEQFFACLDEVDEVLGNQMGPIEPHPLYPTMNPNYVYVRRWCGNRWVWRFVPNPQLAVAPKIRQLSDRLRIGFEDGEQIDVPGGRLLHVDSMSSLGYWIEEYGKPHLDMGAIGGGLRRAKNRISARLMAIRLIKTMPAGE